MRRRPALVAAVAVLAVGTGCAQIPTSGPVIGGDLVEPPGQQRPFIQVDAPPPQPGDTSVGVVNGFVDAMASYVTGYETARMFLTEEAGVSWDTSAGITVYAENRPVIEAVGDDIVRARMTVFARVDGDGTYSAAEPGTTQELEFRLEREHGEWRITNPPAGIVIADFSFDREYEPHNVYFFDPGLEVLVPDPVYLPTNEATATLLAQALLQGPSSWLAPAVRTAFPEGTELGVDAVPVKSGTATVELSEEAGLASPEDRELMTAALTWTLGALPEVERVEVTSGRIPLSQGGQAASLQDGSMARYDPDVLRPGTAMYAVGETGVVSVGDEEVTPIQGPLGAMPGIREVAVSVAGNRAVVVTPAGDQLQAAAFGDDEVVETVLSGVDLSSPAWDRTGLIWAVDHGVDGPGLVAAGTDGQPVQVVAPELDGLDVDRLAVSLDGTRIALVAGGRAFVGDVVRDASAGSTVRIEQLRRVGPDADAVDIGWQAADSVVVLLDTESAEPSPHVVRLSGQVVEPRGAPVEDATRVSAAPGHAIVVETSEGVLFEQRPGNRWSEIAAGTSPTYPG